MISAFGNLLSRCLDPLAPLVRGGPSTSADESAPRRAAPIPRSAPRKPLPTGAPPPRAPLTAPVPIRELPVLRFADDREPRVVEDVYEGEEAHAAPSPGSGSGRNGSCWWESSWRELRSPPSAGRPGFRERPSSGRRSSPGSTGGRGPARRPRSSNWRSAKPPGGSRTSHRRRSASFSPPARAASSIRPRYSSSPPRRRTAGCARSPRRKRRSCGSCRRAPGEPATAGASAPRGVRPGPLPPGRVPVREPPRARAGRARRSRDVSPSRERLQALLGKAVAAGLASR